MKKVIFLVVLAFSAISANAQLTVYPNGCVGIATTEEKTPISPFSVGEGANGFEAAVSGSERGIYGKSAGAYLSWSYGVYGQSSAKNGNLKLINGGKIIPVKGKSFSVPQGATMRVEKGTLL